MWGKGGALVVGGGIAAAAVSTYVGSSIVAGEAEVDNKHDRFTVKVSASVAVVVLPETLPLAPLSSLPRCIALPSTRSHV